MHGQAKGVRDNYRTNKDIYDRNAEYGEESKQQSTNSRIKTLGGVDSAVALDVKSAGLKASTESGAIDEQSKLLEQGINKGKLKGSNIFEAMEDLSRINTASTFGKQVGFAEKLNDPKTAEQMKNLLAQSKDKDGNRLFLEDTLKELDGLSGSSLASWISSKQAGNLSGAMHGMVIDGKSVGFAVGDNGNLRLVNTDSSTKHTSGSSRVHDESLKVDKSKSYDFAYKYKNGVDLQDGLHADPMTLVALAGRYGGEVVDAAIQTAKNGDTKPFEDLLTNIKPGDLPSNNKDLPSNNNEGFSFGDAGALLGETSMGIYAASQIDKKLNPELDANGKKTGRGAWTGKVWDGAENAYNKLTGKSTTSVFDESPNKSTNKSDHSQPNEAQNNRTEQTTHNKSFNSDEHIVPENHPKGNSKGSGWGGFFAERFNAVGEAMEHGGSWKTKLSMAAGAMILGNASETFANTLNLFDPMSHLTGTSTSTDADLKLGQTSAQNLTGVTPAHLQGFATQPSGFHTYNAMMQEQAAQAQVSTAGNIATLTALSEARSGGFTLQEPNGIPVSFTTSKEAGHHIMMNNQDMGMPYQKFSSMMQNQEMAAQFSNALASSDLSNKDGYDFMNRTLLDMDMKTEQANRRQRMFDNASATNQRLDHKETIQALKQKSTIYFFCDIILPAKTNLK